MGWNFVNIDNKYQVNICFKICLMSFLPCNNKNVYFQNIKEVNRASKAYIYKSTHLIFLGNQREVKKSMKLCV